MSGALPAGGHWALAEEFLVKVGTSFPRVPKVCFPKSGPGQNSHKGGDHLCSLERARPPAASRNPLSLPRCPDIPILCWAYSRCTWQWLFGLGLSLFNHVAREIPKEPVPQAWARLCRPRMGDGRERYLLGNRLVTEGVFI